MRKVADVLDVHRKQQLGRHDWLTMTALYNVLEKERAGETLDESERQIHEQGLVGVLRELHDELDAAVAGAYGWDAGLEDEDILYRLVALNNERRAEEKQGRVRWLRPSYQAPDEVQSAMEMEPSAASTGGDGAAPVEKIDWGGLSLAGRTQAIQQVVNASAEPLSVEEVAARFARARRARVRDILDTLTMLGQVEQTERGTFAA
jgi:hypothetical protein